MDSNRRLNIPEEIMFIILTMLPVKSLCRFRCVSKHWLSIISNPNFVPAQLSHSKSRPKFLISVTRSEGIFHKSNDDDMSFYSVEYPEDHPQESPNLHAIAHASVNTSTYTEFTSTNGLICCTCTQGINIVNPITGEFNLIQYPDSDSFLVRFYLGFDPIEKKLAILLVENIRHAPMKNSVFPLQESKWHDTTPSPPLPLYDFGKSVIYVNGFIYFTAFAKLSDCECLYAFDVRSESFELIQYPPYPFFAVEHLFDYKGRVALLCSKDYIVDCLSRQKTCMNEIMMWILEDPKEHHWSFKSFVIPWEDNILESGVMFFGATHRGELIFAVDQISREGSLQLFLYEIDTNTLRRFQVDGFGATSSSTSIIGVRVDFLIESLYSPRISNSSI